MREKQTAGIWVAVVLVALLLLTGMYVGAYYGRGRLRDLGSNQPLYVRFYRTTWEAGLFQPMGIIESSVTGVDVTVMNGLVNE